MALNAYLTLKGQKQGAITGSSTQRGREGTIAVHAYSNSIVSPRDAASGLPTGKRQHTPITILIEIDKAAPQLWQALVNNENITTWQLQFFAPTVAGPNPGTEKQIYTVALTNANIASIREFMLDNQDPTKLTFPLRQEVTFTYQKIQWTWTDGSITASDDWQAPLA